jgi:MipA family protein
LPNADASAVRPRWTLVCAWLVLTAPLAARAAHEGVIVADPAPGSVGLGVGYRFGDSPYRNISNVSSDENNLRTDLVPLYLYEGRRVFARGSWAGIRTYQRSGFGVDMIARYRFDRLEADAHPFYEGMDDREQTVDAGLSFNFSGRYGELSLAALKDLMSRHTGEEYDLSYRYRLATGNWLLAPYVSLIHQSDDLVDYYYGVRPHEVRPGRPLYEAGSGTFWRYGIDAAYQLSRGWRVHGSLGVEHLSDAVRDSPLTDEDWLLSGFAGASYFFPTLYDTRALRPDRDTTWTWRVNAGYTAEANFYKVLQGALRRSDEGNTNLVGLTVGRLLQDHGRFKFWGRFSLNRRLENGHQPDFFEYVGYAMATREVGSPWSDRQLLRWGFGAGFSYGNRVPWVERVKQERRERPDSRLLNYLEAQLDFPLRNWFGQGPLASCHAGLTIVHRSGVFATADLLGNVAGGSNVVTAHLECGL